MTTVTAEYGGELLLRLECVGHAGKVPAGENIVCAAVSVLMENCVNALIRIANVQPDTTVDETRALIAVRLPECDRERAHDAQIILRTTLLGLSDISHEYPHLVKLNILNGRNLP